MNILKKWFDEVMDSDVRIFTSSKSEFTIYKGFKLTKTLNTYKIEDVRFSDFYDKVKDKDYKIMVKLGFIRGADWITNRRNHRRVHIYTKIIEKLYKDKFEYKSKLRPLETRAFYQKKLRNCQENIHKTITLLFLNKSRISQYNSKYNINVKKLKTKEVEK